MHILSQSDSKMVEKIVIQVIQHVTENLLKDKTPQESLEIFSEVIISMTSGIVATFLKNNTIKEKIKFSEALFNAVKATLKEFEKYEE